MSCDKYWGVKPLEVPSHTAPPVIHVPIGKEKLFANFLKIAVKTIPSSHPSSKRIKRSQYLDACSSPILLQPEAKCYAPTDNSA